MDSVTNLSAWYIYSPDNINDDLMFHPVTLVLDSLVIGNILPEFILFSILYPEYPSSDKEMKTAHNTPASEESSVVVASVATASTTMAEGYKKAASSWSGAEVWQLLVSPEGDSDEGSKEAAGRGFKQLWIQVEELEFELQSLCHIRERASQLDILPKEVVRRNPELCGKLD
eukprot:g45463.t1